MSTPSSSTSININEYKNFVQSVTSQESDSLTAFMTRIQSLEDQKQAKVPLLMTSAIGLSSETGEFNEIVKKIIFQGKPLTEDNIFHMKRELGDIMWYWINACRALDLDPNAVIQENIEKLTKRYPDKKFDSFFSENRKSGDL